jgi:hypothetical protein
MEILKAQKLPKQGYDIKITKRFKLSSSKQLEDFLKENDFEVKPQFSVLNDDRFFLLHAEKDTHERPK